MTIALIANPSAGGKKGSRIIPRVEALLRRHRIDFRIFITQHHTHAIDIARNLTPAHFDGVVSLGGDGTNFHVLNGLGGNRPPQDPVAGWGVVRIDADPGCHSSPTGQVLRMKTLRSAMLWATGTAFFALTFVILSTGLFSIVPGAGYLPWPAFFFPCRPK